MITRVALGKKRNKRILNLLEKRTKSDKFLSFFTHRAKLLFLNADAFHLKKVKVEHNRLKIL